MNDSYTEKSLEAEVSRLRSVNADLLGASADLLEAMQAIEHGLHDDKGDYFKLRNYLDKHSRYHGNLECEAVILEVAQVAIRRAEAAIAMAGEKP